VFVGSDEGFIFLAFSPWGYERVFCPYFLDRRFRESAEEAARAAMELIERSATNIKSRETGLKSVSLLASEIIKILDAESRRIPNIPNWFDEAFSAESCKSPQTDSKAES
jgi:hypothetical protein